jgi:membrane protein required for colicin V production
VTLLDLLLFIILGASVFGGFMEGFARVGVGLIAAITGILCGFWFYGTPAVWFHRYIGSVALSNLLGFLVVLMAFVSVGALVGKLLSKILKWTGLSWIDRGMGAVFGLVRGGLMVIAFVAVLMAFTPKPLPTWMKDSLLLPYAVDTSDIVAGLAPKTIKDTFRASLEDIHKAWDEEVQKASKLRDLKKGEPKRSELRKVEQ